MQLKDKFEKIGKLYDFFTSYIANITFNALLPTTEIMHWASVEIASQKIPANHIAEICDVKLEEVVFVLKKMYPLVVSDCDKYYTFHNDVRLHTKDVL